VRISIRVWIREINKRDEIMSSFLEVLKKRFEDEGIILRSP